MTSTPPPEEPASPALRRAAWLRSRWLRWALPLALLMAIGLGLLGARERVKRPDFCGSCHAGSAQAAHASEHAKLECTACHEARVSQDLKQWALGLVSSTRATPHGAVDLARCKSCHLSGASPKGGTLGSKSHVAHLTQLDPPLECSACHAAKHHENPPRAAACAECHTQLTTYGAHAVSEHREISCLSCHNFRSEIGSGAATPTALCQRCHGGTAELEPKAHLPEIVPARAIQPSMLHGNLQTCALCHQPHEQSDDARSRGRDCSLCHAKVSQESHHEKMPDRFSCTTCHEPHSPRTALTTSCANCHEDMAATNTTAAKHQRCSQCHKPHDFVAVTQGCRDCHADNVLELASWDAKTHAECENCHAPHLAAEPVARCATCHKGKGANRHPSCATCHDPHLDADHAKGCATCHEQESATLARSVPQHRARACQTCHEPHAPAAALGACNNCHAREVKLVSTAPPPKHRECLSCHQEHTFGATPAACSSCHQNPTTGPHTGRPCTQCHEQHGPPIGQKAACKTCHADQAPTGKHAVCATCHKEAHGPGLLAAPCASCHAERAAGASSWKPPAHQACASCHAPHDPAHPKSCDQCHAGAAREVRGTQHQCASCHDVHRAPKDFWSTCSSCHARESGAVKGRGPTHSTCSSCHEPHAFSPPTCTSCHERLPAAHQLHQAKARCNDCHDTHARKLPTRADCLSCHKDRTRHQPNAQSCAACHLFTATK